MTAIPFIKMHGCGNDYVFIDCFGSPPPDDPARLSILVSNRHRSIGSDGLVLMLPSDRPDADARMRMFNSDGSEGSLCGNALRCMVKWLHESEKCGTNVRIVMGSRIAEATVVSVANEHQATLVSVKVGTPVVQNQNAVDRHGFIQSMMLEPVELPSLLSSPTFVSMGNPHTVLFVPSLDDVDVLTLGPRIETLPIFPERTNVEFVQLEGPSVARVRVWERGSGETQACGSGACAVAVAGIVRGYFAPQLPVEIRMPGGALSVRWDDQDQVHLLGPAEESFRGTLNM